jgi:membrane protein YdbS with pleckstrin-like domain
MYSKGEDSNTSAYMAAATSGSVFLVNVITVCVLLWKLNVVPKFINTIFWILVILFIIFIFNYLFFVRNSRYLEIEEELHQKTHKQKIKEGFIVALYSFASFVFFCLLVAFFHPGYYGG